ncbi:MAG: M20/M25/M40 family metallo-hydrolase, partial [Gemmatimonadota bacterium]
ARELLASDPVRQAADLIRRWDERTLGWQAELTEIPAPPYGEEARAARMAELFEDAGLAAPEIDQEGNVLALLDGPGGGSPLILSAHLDTVFPAGTDVRVRREGGRLEGPGISDDGRGLAALVTLARTLVRGPVAPARPLLFAATVGEEGSGDLRGVRHLFREDGPGSGARGFVSLDGAGTSRLVTMGLGSRRYRVHARGQGGHSWVDFGTPNPIHALGRLVAGVAALELPEDPATSLTVARWSGGTSINAIPREAWVEMEIRSEEPDPLETLDREMRRLLEQSLARVNEGAPEGARPVEAQIECIGNRPAGITRPDSPLVRAAAAATRALGARPELAVSSTDANIPMTLGIPALTMGAGGEAGNAHTTDEWYQNENGPNGIVRAVLTVLLLEEL